MASSTGKGKMVVVIVVCATLVIGATVGAWVYLEQQKLAQRDRELQQQKELMQYEQSKIDDREHQRSVCSGDNIYAKYGAGC